ncbi:MAG: amidohydrolase family protein [Pseudomonadota bacterium]
MAKPSDWLERVRENIVDPERSIIDAHHHLWPDPEHPYELADLWQDTGSGHRVEKTVFMEFRPEYSHQTDSATERGINETRDAAKYAAQARVEADRDGHSDETMVAQIGAIVGYADLTEVDGLSDTLDAHELAGDGLFRGIRNVANWHADEGVRNGYTDPPPDLYAREEFRAGVELLGKRNLSFDAWNYHTQIKGLAELAQTVPQTMIVLDHLGGPLGIGPYRGLHDSVFAEWCEDIERLAQCENVVVKLGGLTMPLTGFGWHRRDFPATSDELVQAHSRFYAKAVNVFGVDRCMFESNFPVDKLSVSYHVLWNAFKKFAKRYTQTEQDALFGGTARRVYRIR